MPGDGTAECHKAVAKGKQTNKQTNQQAKAPWMKVMLIHTQDVKTDFSKYTHLTNSDS